MSDQQGHVLVITAKDWQLRVKMFTAPDQELGEGGGKDANRQRHILDGRILDQQAACRVEISRIGARRHRLSTAQQNVQQGELDSKRAVCSVSQHAACDCRPLLTIVKC